MTTSNSIRVKAQSQLRRAAGGVGCRPARLATSGSRAGSDIEGGAFRARLLGTKNRAPDDECPA
jgi:hypothetical protein